VKSQKWALSRHAKGNNPHTILKNFGTGFVFLSTYCWLLKTLVHAWSFDSALKLWMTAHSCRTITGCLKATNINCLLACLHDQNKLAFLEGRLFSNQSGRFENFSDCFDWLDKAGPTKKHFCFHYVNRLYICLMKFYHQVSDEMLVQEKIQGYSRPNRMLHGHWTTKQRLKSRKSFLTLLLTCLYRSYNWAMERWTERLSNPINLVVDL